jgi:rhodanese-related sulfurtransferase
VDRTGQLGDRLAAMALELGENRAIDAVSSERENRGHSAILPSDRRSDAPIALDRLFKSAARFPNLGSMTITTAQAAEHFAAKLRFETDPSDVKAAQDAGERLVLVDSRGDAAWRQGRVAGAIHLPTAQIAEIAADLIPSDMPVVVYCWGPGCNGSTRAALAFSLLGFEVREMIGGFEYWAREGLPVVDDEGPVVRQADALAAPVGAIDCAC